MANRPTRVKKGMFLFKIEAVKRHLYYICMWYGLTLAIDLNE